MFLGLSGENEKANLIQLYVELRNPLLCVCACVQGHAAASLWPP